MDKSAQQRSFFSKVRDVANISGRVLEEVNIEFAQVMGKLRENDADIREDATDLKKLATNAVKLVRARHYLDTAVNIAAFHERVRLISAKMNRFNKSVDIKHLGYLLEQLSDNDKEKLFKYNPGADIKLEDITAIFDTSCLIKQAGFTDWLFPSGDAEPSAKQNSAMKALEGRFKIPLLKNLKEQSLLMTKITYSFYKDVISTFKKLGWLVATRKIDQYIDVSGKFIERFAQYHSTFASYYEKNIKPLKEHQEKLKTEQAAKKAVEWGKQNPIKSPFPQAPPSSFGPENPGSHGEPYPFDSTLNQEHAQLSLFPKATPPTSPGTKGTMHPFDSTLGKNTPLPEDNEPINLVKKKPMNLRDRPIMSSFIATIEKLASDDQAEELLSTILKQSADLEQSDPDKSLQLFSIAEGMIEDYKTAGILDFWKKKDEEDKASEDAPGLPLHRNQS